MLKNMFEKALKQEKRSTMVYAREKKVDKDALCLINVGGCGGCCCCFFGIVVIFKTFS